MTDRYLGQHTIDELSSGIGDAPTAAGEIEVDGQEILEADWYSAKTMPSYFPGRVSIAQWLIQDFLKRNGVEVSG